MLLATLAPLYPSVLGQRNRRGWETTNQKKNMIKLITWIGCSPNLLERMGPGFLCTESKITWKWGDMKMLEADRADHCKCLNWYYSPNAMRPLDHQMILKGYIIGKLTLASMIKMEDGQVWLWCSESSSCIFGSHVAMCLRCSWIQKNRTWSHSVYMIHSGSWLRVLLFTLIWSNGSF